MDRRDEDVTPHPPSTAEFGAVARGGPAHEYPPSSDGTRVRKLCVGPFENNVYVIANGGEAILVDGADEPERIIGELDGLRVVAIVETHNHPDHVEALPALVERVGAPVFAHPADPMPVPTEPLADGDELAVGSASLRALHTPGHTPGSVSYVLGTFAFTGDTLFPGGPGGTHDAERFARIMRSVDRLFELPDETRVLPGHGLDTTIGRERPFVEVWRARGW